MKEVRSETDVYRLVDVLGKETWWDKITSPFVCLNCWLKEKRNQRHYRHQRAKRGYSDYDQWAMQDWFVRTARPMLQTLSEKTYHYPDEVTEDQWREILAEMARLLSIMDPWEDGAARELLGVPEDMHSPEIYQRISAERMKAKERFFFLFGKWFYDL